MQGAHKMFDKIRIGETAVLHEYIVIRLYVSVNLDHRLHVHIQSGVHLLMVIYLSAILTNTFLLAKF